MVILLSTILLIDLCRCYFIIAVLLGSNDMWVIIMMFFICIKLDLIRCMIVEWI